MSNIEIEDEIVFNTELSEAQKVIAKNIIAKLDELEKTSKENDEISIVEKKENEVINEIKSQDDYLKTVDTMYFNEDK